MKFKYKSYGAGILRPVIPILIEYGENYVDYEVLVDSGADACVFHADLCGILGIDLKQGERREVGSISGVYKPYYVHPVDITVAGKQYPMKAGFLPNIGHVPFGVVGQRGFFDLFVVTFDLIKEEIDLRPRNP